MRTYTIQSFTYEMRDCILPRLGTAIAYAGGWVVERKTLSPERVEMVFELQTRALLELYSALAAAGIELTRSGQHILVTLCTGARQQSRTSGTTVTLRLEIRFLEDAPLPALLAGARSVV